MVLAASYHQERLWFIDDFERGTIYESSPIYHNIPLIMDIRGHVDHEVLGRSIREVIRRHEALRTRIVTIDAKPVQYIVPEVTFNLEFVKLEDGEDIGERAVALAMDRSKNSFQIDKDTLIRGVLIEADEDYYILGITIHHIIADKKSLAIIAQEIASFYDAYVEGRTCDVPIPPLEYADFSEWQRQMPDDVVESMMFYWRQKLNNGKIRPVELFTDHPRAAIHIYEGGRSFFSIPETIGEKSEAFCKRVGCSNSDLLTAALFIMFYRYTGQEEIIIGTSAENRNESGTEMVVGPMANLLPLMTKLSDDLSFLDALSHVSRTVSDAYKYQAMPFDRLVTELKPTIDMSRTALFDILFQYEGSAIKRIDGKYLRMDLIETNLGWGKYDLNIFIQKSDATYAGIITYNKKYYERDSIVRLTDHYLELLEDALEHPTKLISELSILTEEEQHQLLDEWNQAAVGYPRDKVIHKIFEEQVARTPEAVAVVYEDQLLTYGELNKRANQLARALRGKDVKADDIVAVILDRSIETVVSLMAILKAGGAYLPIDPEYPADRIQFMIDDSGAKVILTSMALKGAMISGNRVVMCVDDEENYRFVEGDLESMSKPSDMAYIIYTSGTTGRPKGVIVEHKNVVRLFFNDKSVFEFRNSDIWTMFHSYTFDFSVWEMYGALLYGGKLIIVPRVVAKDPTAYLQLLGKEEVTVLNQVPSAFYNLANEELKDPGARLNLRYVIFGGEALAPSRLKQWRDRYPGTKLINMYGITETTVHVTYKEITEEEIGAGISNIGRAIPTLSAYIMDSGLRLQPIGVAGEICVGGEGVGRGYLNRPELTDERFVRNPYKPEERLYRSGDLARVLGNGDMEYLGRIDFQVKVRGFRVECGEIEAALSQHENVREVVVVARKEGEESRLIAYFVAKDKEKELTATELREHLRQRLPEYMIPSAFVPLERLPLTVSGKIDRKALPEQEGALGVAAEYVAPRDETEQRLVEIWQEVLKVEKVGIYDNFFDLGGHSLLATQVISRIRETLRVELPVKVIFESPTIEAMAGAVASGLESEAPSIVPVSREGELPLSYAQERLWFINQFEPESAGYNLPDAVRISGDMRLDVLEEAFTRLIERHETLRTVFETRDGRPVQVIKTQEKFRIPVIDLNNVAEADREVEARRIVQEDAQMPFNLSIGPLLRAKVIRLGKQNHVLVVNMHHIISDGWSTQVLINEIGETINALLNNEEPHLPPLAIQYVDYAVWQRKWLEAGELERQLEYWKEHLSGAPELLNLPIDYPRPAIESYRGSTRTFTLSEDLASRLKKLSQEEGATLFMTLLAAFNVLLYRYSGQEDICIGSPIANRNRKEIERLIGFFVNTLVLRTRLHDEQSFRDLLKEVKKTTLGAYDHQDLPFEKLVEELHPHRQLSYSPLFQVAMALQNVPTEELRYGELQVLPFDIETNIAKFDLMLNMTEDGGELIGVIEYSTDLFRDDTIDRMIVYLERILRAVVDDVDRKISEIELLDERERHRLLVEWNDTATDYPRDKCIHELFEEQVRINPCNIAVDFDDAYLTYEELNARSNQLARYLRKNGVAPGSIVGMLVDRSFDMIIGIMGILKAGAAYLPIEPDTPERRMNYVLKDSKATLLLTKKNIEPNMTSGVDIIYLDDYGLLDSCADNLENKNTSDDLAYVIYTSGSTGQPKGNLIEHRSVVRVVKNTNYIKISERDVVLQLSNYAFDGSVFDIYGALLNGSRLVLVDEERLLDINLLAELIVKKGVSVFFVTTALFNVLIDNQIECLKSVRKILFGGERVSFEHSKRALEYLKGNKIIHVYGPTESTVYSTYYELNHIEEDAYTIPIGKPISNTTAYILGKHDELLPIGINGELCISGDGLAQGYLGSPELTAMKFVPNPFEKGKRLYRTGDLVKRLSDGNIAFVGRIDYQVKIRGFRIELGEIESILSQYDEVKELVVVTSADESLEKRLIAYLVPKNPDKKFTITELKKFLADRFPDYMIPSAFVQLAALPLTANGKVDRRSLPAPEEVLGGAAEYVAPRNEREERLADIWREVLGVERVGVYDNFFDLGGHSLLATQVISRIREIFMAEVPVKAIFESSTIEGLAEAVSRASGSIATVIKPVPREGDLPLSYAQERLWFLDQLEPDSIGYNEANVVRIRGEMRIGILEEAFSLLIERHENLRTVYQTREGKAVQVIKAATSLRIPVVDLKDVPEGQRETRARELAKEITRTPFNLSEGPLLRVNVIRLGDSDHVLVLNMHHIISDGWSMGVLIKELGEIMHALLREEEPQLLPLPIQYVDYSVWQRKWLDGWGLEEQLGYWKRNLSGAPELLNLPTDYGRQSVQNYNGSSRAFAISQELTSRLKSMSQREGVTLFMTILAAFNVLLYRYSGEADICIGSPVANRNRKEIEGLIGFFVNTLVLRTRLDGEQSFRDLLKEVKKTTLGAYDHQDVPFEKLVEVLQPHRQLNYNPLFQVMISFFQHMSAEETSFGDIQLEEFEMESGIAKFDLVLDVEEADGRLECDMEYSTDLFHSQTINRMVRHFKRILDEVINDVEIKIADIDLLDETEKHKILVEWNEAKADFSGEKCIHALFEEQVEKTPDNIAVEYKDQQLTYRELNRRANKLGHYLQKMGVGPEVRVGLGVERSLEMIVGLLGILKAGGAYVPLDPLYPSARHKMILEDTQVPVVLTQKKFQDLFAANARETICLDSEWEFIDRESQENLDHELTPQNLAYVIYTSGSTGKPNGVLVEHRALVNFVSALVKEYSITPEDRLLQFSSIIWDTAGEEIYPALTTGATLVLRTDEMLATMFDFLRLCDKWQVTALNLPTAFWQELMLAISREHFKFPSAVRFVVIGGERANPEHIALWQRQMDGKPRLINSFGTTETTAITTLCDLSRMSIDPQKVREISIGRHITNIETYILDQDLKPVPIGVAGELMIGGMGVARGYLNNGGLTSERFIPSPFWLEPGDRLYRTGDLARYLPDGEIGFIGRSDFQVKIRGMRVECGEIESILSRHEDIKEVAVVARKDGEENRLVAYIVQRDKTKEMTATELRDFLAEKLPDYMIPSIFAPIDKLPMTSSGKVDRKALPEPEKALGVAEEYVAPRNETEQKLADIWQEVLEVEEVGIHDNFFDRGGDSILSIQIISKAAKSGIFFNAKDMFLHQTLAELAEAVKNKRKIEAEQGLVEGRGELGLAEEWFFDLDWPDRNHFNISALFKVEKDLDTMLLQKVVQALIRHHDMLRCRYRIVEGRWEREISRELPYIEIQHFNIDDETPEGRAQKIEEICKPLQKSLSLSEGRLLTVAHFKMRGDEFDRLLIIVHHLVTDIVSLDILAEDMITAYNMLKDGKEIALPAKTTSYSYWTKKLREYSMSDEVKKECAYWLRLSEVVENGIPLDNSLGRNLESTNKSLITELDEKETALLLREIPKTYHTQMNELLLTALLLALCKWSGVENGKWLVLMVGHGREGLFEDVDLSRTVGFFPYDYPVLLEKVEGEGVGDLIRKIRQNLRGIPHNGIGYPLLRYMSEDPALKRELSKIRCRIGLNYRGQFQALQEKSFIKGEGIEPIGPDYCQEAVAEQEIYLGIHMRQNALSAECYYSAGRYNAETINRFVSAFKCGLEEIIRHCLSKMASGENNVEQ